MTHRIIVKPSIIPFSVPAILPQGLSAFVAEHGLNEIIDEKGADSPIGRIVDHVTNGSAFTDAEILVEFGGRQCYRAWRAGRETPEYVENILASKHGSVLAHAHFTFLIAGVSRTLTHELIRHAAGVDISEESQRYVDAEKVRFVVPPILLEMWDNDITCQDAQDWLADKLQAVENYNRVQADIEMYLDAHPKLVGQKRSEYIKRANEAARADLPNAAETRLQWTVNARALRHILMIRGDTAADLEIRRFAAALTPVCKALAPTFFDDITVEDGDFGVNTVIGTYQKV